MQREDFILNPDIHRRIYKEIEAQFLTPDTKSDHPKAYLLGGQPGSGKTRMRDAANDLTTSVIVNTDELRSYHRDYDMLKDTVPDKASFLVNEDAAKWSKQLLDDAIETRRNIIFDSTFGTNDQKAISDTLQALKNKGFETELWVLAVPEKLSKLGIYLRNEYMIAQSGTGRFVSMKSHDLNYENIPRNIDLAVNSGMIDKVCIYSRFPDHESEHMTNGETCLSWALIKDDPEFKDTAKLFTNIRNRSLTPVLQEYYSLQINEVQYMIDQRLEAAYKEKNPQKVSEISQYKRQFLKDISVSKGISV